MTHPDFAVTDVHTLQHRDLRFLLEHFPEPGHSYEEIAVLIGEFPTTLESMLDSEFVSREILESRELLLDISPFLLFNVLLRQVLGRQRSPVDRRVIHYIANLLSLFVNNDRVHRIQAHDPRHHEYLVGMIDEAARAEPRRQFLIYAHIGNYALYLTGVFPRWIEHRHRFKRRPVDTAYYLDFGRVYFERAASHPLAREYRLGEVFLRLALLFDQYREALNRMAQQYLPTS
ncbi:MAG: hypothetical protein B7Z66_06335 [Chromatiales bacterium 21-64-14]|nr:MAG: hypothetical protein B7Z66_06335 [Chromatiales bacterium 21-64-14]HQU15869.1 hypothetical protein [Gammaproteobacteria bacterium]